MNNNSQTNGINMSMKEGRNERKNGGKKEISYLEMGLESDQEREINCLQNPFFIQCVFHLF